MKIVKDLGKQYANEKSKTKTRFCICECPICKVHFRANYYNVKNGLSTKCNSCARKNATLIHGRKPKRLYSIWVNMRSRCRNVNNTAYKYYGGKGVSICSEWDNFLEFKKWALNNGYKTTLTIDRIDGNKDYMPSNCRWADKNTQSQNTASINCKNTSGFRGVSFHKGTKKWQVNISVNGKSMYLGLFNTKKEASIRYKEFVILNNLEHNYTK